MKSFESDLEKYAKKTRLKASERKELRERVLSYMEYHPLPNATDASPKRPAFLTIFNTVSMRITASAFAFVMMVASVPFIAEQSVPGDVLYPIKRNLNESISAQFADSPYEKISYETELLERRIAEARLLAKEGRLTEQVEAEIAETVKGHADAAQKEIAALKASDIDEAAIAEINFGSALDVQSAMLASDRGAAATGGLVGAVLEAKAEADAQKGTSTPSYDRLLSRVEEEVTRTYESLGTINGAATSEEKASIEERLGGIEQQIQEAKNIHSAEVSGSGIPELSAALANIRKLSAFMTNIDVRESVPLESLIPEEETDEERVQKAEQMLTEAEDALASLKERADALPEDVVRPIELTDSISELDQLLGEVAVDDDEQFAATMARAEALLIEIEAMVDGLESRIEAEGETEQNISTDVN